MSQISPVTETVQRAADYLYEETTKLDSPISMTACLVLAKHILGHAQTPAEPVQDTWLVGGPDLKAMSGSVESDRVIQLHFRRTATDQDRKWLLDAINEKIATDRAALSDTSTDGNCPRCKREPIDKALLGSEAEGHICGTCWSDDRDADSSPDRTDTRPDRKSGNV